MEEKPNTQDEIKGTDFEEENEGNKSASDEGNETEEKTKKSTNSEKSQDELEKEEKAKNAHFAEMRRKQEAEEKAKKDAETAAREKKIAEEAVLQAKLGWIKKNPFTDEPIKDEEDLRIYEIQKQLDEEGKDPLSDLPKRLAEIHRKEVADAKAKAEKEEKEKKETQSKIDSEIAELRSKYPKVDTSALAKDSLFQECLKGRAGRWTQVEIYEYYLSEKAKADAKAKEEKSKSTVDENSKKISTAPSSKNDGKLPTKTVSEMSPEEFREYWTKKYGS